MAEQKAAQQPKAEEQKAPEKAPLGSAGASSNPLVHQLLAERNIAASDGVDDEDAVKAIDAKLAVLGVSVST
jgi:uncharacterized membrane protein YebE (DUF533 family)